MRWYGDNSELNGIWDAELPDILMFGGISIFKDEIPKLTQLIDSNKRKYSPKADFPIKYNFRDLKQWFKNQKREDLYSKLLSESKTWRYNILNGSLDVDYKIVVACVNFYSKSAKKIKSNKEKVARYTFSNALMRVALLVKDSLKESSVNGCEVFLDWPDGRNHIPFTQEYRSAFYNGCCHSDPEIKYYSGPLEKLGFSESPYFTKMEECTLLQFSDIILGTTRDFVDYCLDKKDINHFGVKLTKILVPKYRGYPGRIVGRGISAAPSDGTLSTLLLRGMYNLRHKA